MTRRLTVLSLLALGALWVLGGGTLEARAASPHPRVDVQLTGPLVDATVVGLGDGARRLAVLVGPPKVDEEDDGETEDEAPETEPPERPRTLLLVDPESGRTEVVADGLPTEARSLTALAREEGGDLIVVLTRAGALVVDPAGGDGAAELPSDRAFRVLAPDGLTPDSPSLLATVRPGTLEVFRALPDGTLSVAASFPLPKRAERTRWGLRVTSPPVHLLDGDSYRGVADAGDTETPCWAAGPEPHGRRRLRTLLYCTGRDEPLEVWSLLPEGETVTETLYTRYGERPVLAVLTRTKLGLFVKQHLRLFALEASRNRVGAEPLLAAETGCPLWRGSTLGFVDADGDGLDDLYLLCAKGLVDEELRLEVYAGQGGGRSEAPFEARARDAELDGDYSSRSFRSDWTGDGLPDLLAVRRGTVELHAGTGGRRRPIDRGVGRVIDLGGEEGDDEEDEVVVEAGPDGEERVTVRLGGPRILGGTDLDGDGRPELVLYRGGTPGGRITILDPGR